jgi:uncharacterized protein YndB with AHSA1/START domain
MTKPEFVYEMFVRATAEEVWRGLTSPEFTRQYFYGTEVASDWQVGSRVVYTNANGGRRVVEGEVVECEPPRRLTITWHALWSEEAAAESPSRVSFQIEPQEGVCRLRVVHDSFPDGSRVLEEVSQGWSGILSSLKSLLETGEALPLAGNQ